MNRIRLIAAHLLLVAAYAVTWLIATLGRAIPRRSWKPTGRIAVTGTIFNPNWYLSHVTPLIRSGVREVILVIDEPQEPLEGVRFACPPKWLAKLISRAGAKAMWMVGVGFRYRPDLFMGYNLVAGGCTALVAGAILGRPACYQMTGGQAVLSTVDFATFDSEKASRFRQRVSKVIERLAVSIIRRFDLVVVRGSKAKAFLARYGMEEKVNVITGSVRAGVASQGKRAIDLVFIGRLEPVKQANQFIEIVEAVSRLIPSVKATVVGDGSLLEDTKAHAAKLGVTNNIEFLGRRKDVEQILASSRMFVLTSQSEGLSIAMAEAMANGTVPVVANVGELGDLVVDGVNGFLITPDHVAEYVDRILPLLTDASLWARYSRAAIDTARERCDIEVITQKWSRSIRDVIEPASGGDLGSASGPVLDQPRRPAGASSMKSDARSPLASAAGEIAARRATPEDVGVLMDLCRGGFPGTLLWDGPRFLSGSWWTSAVQSASAETWLFSIDAEPCGVCVLVHDMDGWQAEPFSPKRSWAVRLRAAALCPKLVLSRLVKKVLGPGPAACECPRSEAVAAATGSRTHIRLLAVAPHRRRQGAGKSILQFCEDRTTELGREIIELSVFTENTSARRLYVQQGYVCTNHGRAGCVFTKLLRAPRLSPVRANAEP